jgi:hypothetical protein
MQSESSGLPGAFFRNRLYLLPSSRRGQISLAASHKIPTMYQFREFAISGDSSAIGPRSAESYKQGIGAIMLPGRAGQLALASNPSSGYRDLADGFSCREQIEQCSGRRTQHIAEVLANVCLPPGISSAYVALVAGASALSYAFNELTLLQTISAPERAD